VQFTDHKVSHYAAFSSHLLPLGPHTPLSTLFHTPPMYVLP